MYKLKDKFTTWDGSWVPDGRKYSITPEMAAKYGNEPIDGKGCATCFFVKLEGGPATEVHYWTTAGYVEDHPVDASRWAHATMYNPGSGYNPTNNVGPWSAVAKDAPSDIIDGVGLPAGEHVSTFAVLAWEEGAEIPDNGGPDIPPDTDDEIHILIEKNGEVIFEWRG